MRITSFDNAMSAELFPRGVICWTGLPKTKGI